MAKKKPRGPDPNQVRGARVLGLAWVILPSAVVAVAVVALMRWPAPASIKVDAIASRVSFHGRGGDPQVLLAGATVRTLVLRGFHEVRLRVAAVSIANPDKYDLQRGTYPASAWTPLPHEDELVLRPTGREKAGITIRPEGKPDSGLGLDRVIASSAEVTLESPEKNLLGVDIRGEKPRGTVQLPPEFTVVADYCQKDGAPVPYNRASWTMRVLAPESERLLDFSSEDSGVYLGLELPPGSKGTILDRGGFGIDRVEFLDQDAVGRPVSTLSGPGTIEFQRAPSIMPVRLGANEFLNLGRLESFYVQEAAPATLERSLQIRMEGVAGKLESGPAGLIEDRRPSRFDLLWKNSTLAALFTVLAWLVPTLVAVRKYYKELQP